MNIKNILSIVCLFANTIIYSQNGSLHINFTPHDGGRPVTMQLTAPLLKFNNPHGYWFVNPHNGDRHVQFQPDKYWGDRSADVAFITLNEKKSDIDFYDESGNDSDQVSFKNKVYVISAPEYNRRDGDKNKPLHVHINAITSSECSFTVSGEARMGTIATNTWVTGTVEGSVHIYREPAYDKSDLLPGCDCDPTIYATVYDEENNVRTASACESALKNKLFDAVQKALAPLFTKVATNKNAGGPGNINISMIAGHIDINVPVKERLYCSSDYRHNWLTGIAAHKSIFSNEDSYGLRFIKLPNAAELNGGSADPEFTKKKNEFMQASVKQVAAGTMTADQFTKAMGNFDKQHGVETQDFKKMEMNHNLYITIFINPVNRETMLMKVADKSKTVVQHNVKGSAFEIFTPENKDNTGDWTGNRLFIYFGKFETPVAGKSAGGFDAETTKIVYPANGNKLSIYSIIIKMDGDKDMENKAVAAIDFTALQKLITQQ